MKRKTIVHVGSGSHGKGGVASVIRMYHQSQYLADRYNLIDITSHADKNASKCKKLAVAVGALLKMMFLLPRTDIVHIHAAAWASFYRKGLFLNIARLFGKRAILHLHSGEFHVFYRDHSGPRAKALIRKTLIRADRVVVLTENWKICLEDIVGDMDGRLLVITNPVIFPPEEERTKIASEDGKLNILCMGRLGQMKGAYDLIKTGKRLCPEFPQIRFVLCGDGEIDKVKMIIKAEGLEEFFTVPGWTAGQEKTQRYRQADIYILPSHHEGLPISILEAASYRLPIIASPVGGIPDIIKDRQTGLLVMPGDIDSICDGLRKMITDEGLRAKLAENAHEFVKNNFTLEHVSRQLDELYRQTLNQE